MPISPARGCRFLLFGFWGQPSTHVAMHDSEGLSFLVRGETHLAHPAEVGQRIQISVFHGAWLGALRCHQQAGLVQLSRQLGLHLRVLRDQVPACANTSAVCSYAPCRLDVEEQPNRHIQCSMSKQLFTVPCLGMTSLYGVSSDVPGLRASVASPGCSSVVRINGVQSRK